ncbi:hypothetical protein BOTBODRAFT_58481 [Botryobasidium botryosum FD-172 SS1]|uniref:D-xylose 1-dehydrogenase (NADP(+), D-xylono-1,5-lactone-forming) n=1 Tax=Botryobasidium botryosum (strain FD-172 SS1) TaxID=930990 RepID=A0A067MCR1_BOTB1|nr:hypothetical protein BOTBODRAFT_58481 [Botryobasidium botryosum FD-172 SS1]
MGDITFRLFTTKLGGIAQLFAKDLLLDPRASRGVADVRHVIRAVGSSTSTQSSRDFIRDIGGSENEIVPYGSYEDTVADPDVDIVYIATPASHHYANVLLALNASKHVCFTINARQTAHVISVARAKQLFLTEAVWTRFFPLTRSFTRQIHELDTIGKIARVSADFSLLATNDRTGRLWKSELGGGALLDLGIYSIIWVFIALFRHPNNQRQKPEVVGSIVKDPETGVDVLTNILLTFPRLQATAVATTSLLTRTPNDYSVIIQGDKGEISIDRPAPRPTSYNVRLYDPTALPVRHVYDIPSGQGLYWEADACARAIRDGRLETEESPLDESLAVMEVMDTVRAQNGYVFPGPLEDVHLAL